MPRSEWTDENKSYAMCFFPWIGAVIGLLSYGVFRFSKWFDGNGGGNYSLFFVIFLILIPVCITGGIHLDGFLDTQDALSSWQTKERRLEILKDSHAGAFAIISCIIYFLMYIGVYSCLSVRSMDVIAYSFMLSRTLSGLSVVTFPQARKKGMVADFSESASTRITRMRSCTAKRRSGRWNPRSIRILCTTRWIQSTGKRSFPAVRRSPSWLNPWGRCCAPRSPRTSP